QNVRRIVGPERELPICALTARRPFRVTPFEEVSYVCPLEVPFGPGRPRPDGRSSVFPVSHGHPPAVRGPALVPRAGNPPLDQHHRPAVDPAQRGLRPATNSLSRGPRPARTAQRARAGRTDARVVWHLSQRRLPLVRRRPRRPADGPLPPAGPAVP